MRNRTGLIPGDVKARGITRPRKSMYSKCASIGARATQGCNPGFFRRGRAALGINIEIIAGNAKGDRNSVQLTPREHRTVARALCVEPRVEM